MNIIEERIKYWLDLTEYDMTTAEAMLESKRYLYVGFMCHQVIEKSIKAYYWYSKKSEPPYTHNLLILAEKSDLLPLLNDEKRKLINELIPLNIQSRYPEDKNMMMKLMNFDKSKSLIERTNEIFKWIKTLLT